MSEGMDEVWDEFEEKEEEEEEPKPEPQEEEEEKKEKKQETLDEEEAEEVSESEEGVSEEEKEEVESEYDISDDEGEGVYTITVYGTKGTGKTTLVGALPGSKFIISMDRKTKPVKDNLYDGDEAITVKNGIKYISEKTPELKLKTANETYDYILEGLLDDAIEKEGRPDWVVFDDSDKLVEIAEMKMRYRNGLGPYEGIKNRNIWKHRKDMLRTLHKRAAKVAKKGVVYTCFTDEKKIIEEGEFVTREDIPNWYDIIMKRTDAVLYVYREQVEDGIDFRAQVETAKLMGILDFKTGADADITNIFEDTSKLDRLLR